MGYLKSTIESTLVYAEQKKLPDYVSAIRKSWKPADSVVAGVEGLITTHGATVLDKIDLKLDPVVDAASEKYGKAKEKCSNVIEYAQTKKDGVVSYAQEKKEVVIMTVKEKRDSVTAATEDIVRKVKTGEIEQTLLKKTESNAYASWVAKALICYKGKLLCNAEMLTSQVKAKSNEQIVAFTALAKQLKGKLPIAEVNAQVLKFTEFVMAKSSPFVAMVNPYYAKAKTEFNVAKEKVYQQVMLLKKTYLAKKTA
jgi:hypothetical protein